MPYRLVLVLALTLATPAAATDCATFFGPEVITGRMEVGTFHHTGEIAPPRLIPFRWPRAGGLFTPAIEGNEAQAPERDRLLRLELDTGRFDRKLPRDATTLDIVLSATDYLPIGSLMAVMGQRNSKPDDLRRRPDGTTYVSWDGYVPTGETLPGGWRGIAYPDVFIPPNDQFDLYIRENEAGDITGALHCTGYHSASDPPCKILLKREPVFAQGYFLRSNLPRLDLILDHMTDTLACAF